MITTSKKKQRQKLIFDNINKIDKLLAKINREKKERRHKVPISRMRKEMSPQIL